MRRSQISAKAYLKSILTMHVWTELCIIFARTLTELTLNLVSGGDFRRKPEINTCPSPISTMNLFLGNRLEIFFYTWSQKSTDYSRNSLPLEYDHLRNTEVTTGQAEKIVWLGDFDHMVATAWNVPFRGGPSAIFFFPGVSFRTLIFLP